MSADFYIPIEPDEPPREAPSGCVRIVPLGGLGEFGKNMMTMEYGDDMIIVDCGQMFPEEEMLGVDSVIPDFSYVDKRLERVRGLVLTHGHEDHIGALPYFLRDMDVPVYGTPLTLALLRGKLREMGIEQDCELIEVKARATIKLGRFSVEFIHVSHSIPETMALAITTPAGVIIHTGDYKFDDTHHGDTSDYERLQAYGDKGVLALLADSTNVERVGHSPSERSVLDALRPIITAAEGAVILSTFASGLHRLQSALSLGEELGRTVSLAGASLERNFATATKLGLLRYPEGLVVSLRDIQKIPPGKRLIVATGSQGEPLSALSRMSLDDYRSYRIEPGDTAIISARMIPGNERGIYRMINRLYKRGARVITEKDAPIHASGHAYRDEMLRLYELVRPKYLVPIHGELRNLIGQRDLAVEVGMKAENVFIVENGDALDFGPDFASHGRGRFAGQSLVDGKVFDPLEEIVLRDRKHLAEDGMILVILVIDRQSHKIIAGPDIVSRGFVEVDRNEDLMDDCKAVVVDAFEDCKQESKEEWEVVKTSVRKALRRFLKSETDRYPVILPVVMEV